MPPESTNLDYEGEIAVIIGKSGRRISQEKSWSTSRATPATTNGSVRDWQRTHCSDRGQELQPHRRIRPVDGHAQRDR